MARLLDAACRRRYVVLGVVAVGVWLDALSVAEWQGQDWHFFLAGANAATGGAGLHVYADMPWLQFGPLALLVPLIFRDAGPQQGWIVVSGLGMLLGLWTLWALERAAVGHGASRTQVQRGVLLAGPFFLAAWASPAVSEGHPDDVLALAGVALAACAVARGRSLQAAVFIGLAAAAKPWALLVLPLAVAGRTKRLRALAVALAVAALPWLPFLLADHATTQVGRFRLRVEAGSTLHYLGVAMGAAPSWPRLLQLAVALTLGILAVVRGRWWLVPVLAFAVRINLDPGSVDYYGAGVVFGALVWDAFVPLRASGLRTVLAWLLVFYVPDDVARFGTGGAAYGDAVVALRLLALALPVACLGAGRELRRGRESPR
jgi:hypothetical protein